MCANMNCVFGGKLFVSILILLGYVEFVRGRSTKPDSGHLSERLINDLYQKYKEAVSNDADIVILRRLFDHNRLFEIHIKKLKEVNGLKQHNLMIKGNPRSGNNPFIYINNPVESKIPNAYLTLEEFKEALTKRVEKQRENLTTKARRIEFDVDKIKRAYTKNVQQTTYEDSLQTLLYDKGNDIDNFLKSLYSAPQKDIMLRASDTKETKKSKKKTLATTDFTVFIPEDISSAITETVADITFENSLQTEIIDEVTKSSDVTKQEKSSKPEALQNKELIFYRPAIDDTDSIIRTTKDVEVSKVTRTSLIDFPRSEVRTNREAIQPNNYLTTALKSALNKTDDHKNQIPNISTINNPKGIEVNKNEDTSNFHPKQEVSVVTTVSPMRETPKRNSTINKTIIKNKSIITKRSTLGRPLVFIGGP